MTATPVNTPGSINGSGASALSLRSIVSTLYRRKWIVLAVAVPIILAGGLGLSNQSGSFWATARVLVELSNVDRPRWNVNGGYIDYDRELSTMFNTAMSVPVAKIAALSLEDSIPVIQGLDPSFAEIRSMDDVAVYLMGNTNVSVVGESRILEFQVGAPHPRLALMGVGAMQEAFVDFQVYGQKNMQAISYYDEQIAVVRAQVDSLLLARSTILEETGYSEMGKEMQSESNSRLGVEYDLMKARSARMVKEIEYNMFLLALEGDPLEFPMGETENRSPMLINWRRIVGDHQEKLNWLMGIHTENSIPVLQQRELLESAILNLGREERAYVEGTRIALEKLILNESVLEEQVKLNEDRQRSAPQAFYQISMIDAESNSLRDVMENLQAKLAEVRISLLADERVSSIIPLTQPGLSEVVSSGKSIMYFLVLTFFAMALGIVAAFVLEIIDHRISSSEEITEHLNLPVFANILKVK